MKWTRSFVFIAIAVFVLNFNQGVAASIQNNFFKEDLHLVGAQMGYFTATREFVGFLLVLVAAVTASYQASKVAGVALIITAVGYWGYGQVDSFGQLLIVAIVASLGFHTWLQVYYVLGLSLAERGSEGRVMGTLASVGSIGLLVAMIITLFVVGSMGMRAMFTVSAVVVAAGSIGLFFVPTNPGLVRQRGFVFKKPYWLYYVLNFLDGCRAEIFMSFAVFALVDSYGISVQIITMLLIVNSIINWVAAPIFGGWIDRYGERPVLTICYVAHVAIFMTFALVPNAIVLSAMYILYRTFSLGTIATNTYIKKIAEPSELAPSLAMGVTMMHAAAVVVPIIGGMLWQAFGYQISFVFGAIFVVMSVAFTQVMRTPAMKAVEAEVKLAGQTG